MVPLSGVGAKANSICSSLDFGKIRLKNIAPDDAKVNLAPVVSTSRVTTVKRPRRRTAGTMNRLLSHNLWPTISKMAKNSIKRGAIAYVSNDIHLQFGDGDLLVCDASQAAIKSAQTDAHVLKRAFDRGAALYSLPGLHSKILLLNEKAIIGSANVSGASATSLIEAALLTDQPTVVAMAQALVGQLASQATQLTEKQIDRLLQIDVVRRPVQRGTSRPRPQINEERHRHWVVGTTEILHDVPEDQEVVESAAERMKDGLANARSSVHWLRWTGRSSFRDQCRIGDWLIQMWSPHNRKTPSHIYERMPIVGREDFDTATYIFYEKFSRADSRAKEWSDFKKLAVRAGIKRLIRPGSHFEISESQADALQAIWTEK